MNNLADLYAKEPSVVTGAISGLVGAIIDLVVVFGVPITGDQKVAIVGLTAALVAFAFPIISGIVTRSKVSPVAKAALPGAVVAPAPSPTVVPPSA